MTAAKRDWTRHSHRRRRGHQHGALSLGYASAAPLAMRSRLREEVGNGLLEEARAGQSSTEASIRALGPIAGEGQSRSRAGRRGTR